MCIGKRRIGQIVVRSSLQLLRLNQLLVSLQLLVVRFDISQNLLNAVLGLCTACVQEQKL